MRDLDIRGAGNMLGAEQSGFIADVGFETYHRILDESVEELRAEEFAELFDEKPRPPANETSVDVDADALIPESYLSNRIERLNLYRRISDCSSVEELELIREELSDRFGPPPREVSNLVMGVELKILGQLIRLPKIVFKNERLFLSMPPAEDDAWFYENRFQPLLEQLSLLDNNYVLKESRSGKLRAIIQEVESLSQANSLLKKLSDSLSD